MNVNQIHSFWLIELKFISFGPTRVRHKTFGSHNEQTIETVMRWRCRHCGAWWKLFREKTNTKETRVIC